VLVIVDYGLGNRRAVLNMILRAGGDARLSGSPEDIARADKLILPGVGSFDRGMEQLRALGLAEVLEAKVVKEGAPILGICLGMQLFTGRSEEGHASGLGWLDAVTVRFDQARLGRSLRVPHMGWSDVSVVRESRLLGNMGESPRFYFCHSYHVRCGDDADAVGLCEHGYSFPAAIERGHLAGVQFHPEKSHKWGLRLIQNFIEFF